MGIYCCLVSIHFEQVNPFMDNFIWDFKKINKKIISFQKGNEVASNHSR